MYVYQTTEEDIVYKVVRDDWMEKFVSCTIQHVEWMLTYEIGVETKAAHQSKVFAFDTLENAKAWIGWPDHYPRFHILKCKGRNISCPPVRIPAYYQDSIHTLFKKFWQLQRTDSTNDFYGVDRTPRGTVFCESVTPIEEVSF